MASLADDDIIEHRNVEQFSGLRKMAGDFDVGCRDNWFALPLIAGEDYRFRIGFNRCSENLARMNELRAGFLGHDEVVAAYCAVAMNMQDNETPPLRIETRIREDVAAPIVDCHFGMIGFWNIRVR